MGRSAPFVRVVVLSYDGVEMTLECLRSIISSDWPSERLEVVLVDNGSLDDVVERVRAELPEVRILEPMENLGFARGCNLGIRSTRSSSGTTLQPYDFIALVNNDATVSRNWLAELVPALEGGERVGAVSPKMLFSGRYSEIEVSGIVSDRNGSTHAPLRVTAVRIDGIRSDEAVSFDEGFARLGPFARSGSELDQATIDGGRIRIRRDLSTESERLRVSIRIEGDARGRISLRTDVDHIEVDVGPERWGATEGGQWIDCEIGSDTFDVVNNAGSELYLGGSAGDRGFLERDRGQYGDPAEVFAWCGGAVLLKKQYLDDVGLFDDAFFLYYEDTDLAWRGRLKGWTYRYVPSAVVRHRHAQSSVAGSDLFRFQVERNRLLVLTKNAPPRVAVTAVVGSIRQLGQRVYADVIRQALKLSPPRLREVRFQSRVLSSFATLLTHALRNRWTMRCRLSRTDVYNWARTKSISRPHFAPSEKTKTGIPDLRSDAPATVTANRGPVRHVAIYNLFWDTLGGGEVVSGEIAHAFGIDHEVTLLGPNHPGESFHTRLGIDISSFSWREVNDDAEASRASADFDVFVNCTYSSRAVNRAPVGIYYVFFPRTLVTNRSKYALEAGVRLAHLAQRVKVRTSKFVTAERLFRERLGDDSWVGSYATFVATSKYTQRWIETIWKRPSEVVYPPVQARALPGSKNHSICSIGRFFDSKLGHSKKQLEMLTAFSDMARSYEGVGDWRLALVGGADSASRDYVMRIRRAAQGLPIDIHVNASRELVDETLSRSSIYWHASGYGEDEVHHPERFEHFGISIVEAMAAGAVPLVFAAAGPMEIVRDGVDGFHWHSLEQLAQQTRRLMGDPEMLRTMSESAQSRARDFDVSVFRDRMRSLANSLRIASQGT